MTDQPDTDNPPPGHMGVRLQATSDVRKARRQYEELWRKNQIAEAVIIARLTRDRGWHILSQGMKVDAIPMALYACMQGVEKALELHPEHGHPQEIKLTPHGIGQTLDPDVGREDTQPSIKPEVKTASDGTLIPPKGETFIRCGECNNPSYFITVFETGHGLPARLCCTKCGNEVKYTVMPGSGTA
jgi:hypothetical protein